MQELRCQVASAVSLTWSEVEAECAVYMQLAVPKTKR